MARDFPADPATPSINLGSDASVDNFTTKTALAWVFPRTDAGITDTVLAKSDGNASPLLSGWEFRFMVNAAADTGHIQVIQEFATADGLWDSPANSCPADEYHHVGLSYDSSSSANDPDLYVDGALQVESETLVPAGASEGDATETLRVGAVAAGALRNFDGVIGFVVYDDTAFTAASVNRARWWGVAPGGPSTVDVWHPLWTDSLINKGDAVADGVNDETTMTSLPKVERMYAGMMGVGR